MTRIKRGGRELTVNDSVVAEYLKEGYSVIDDHGNEITRGTAQNLGQALRELNAERQRTASLSQALADANERIAALEAEIASLMHANKQPEEPEQPAEEPKSKARASAKK